MMRMYLMPILKQKSVDSMKSGVIQSIGNPIPKARLLQNLYLCQRTIGFFYFVIYHY